MGSSNQGVQHEQEKSGDNNAQGIYGMEMAAEEIKSLMGGENKKYNKAEQLGFKTKVSPS